MWQNAGLKNGKVLVLYVVTHFHDIIFQVDHVWPIRGSSFANLKVKGGSSRKRWPRGLPPWELYVFLLQVII